MLKFTVLSHGSLLHELMEYARAHGTTFSYLMMTKHVIHTQESQLIFNGHTYNTECVRMVNEQMFVTCGEDGYERDVHVRVDGCGGYIHVRVDGYGRDVHVRVDGYGRDVHVRVDGCGRYACQG